jgi:uncharacterized protein (TIGR02001 family)
MKKIVFAAILAVASSPVLAQLSTNLGLASDNRFRGISLSQNSASLQAGVKYVDKSGFYAGNQNSSVSSQLFTNAAGVEVDLYAGYKKELTKGVAVDVGSMNYFYPRAGLSAAGKKFDTNEVYAAFTVGPLTAKLNQSLSNYFGLANSVGSRYWQLDGNLPVAPNLTLQAHVGRTKIAGFNVNDHTDYKIGASYAMQGWNLGAHWYTNTATHAGFEAANTLAGQQLYKNALVVSAAKSF